MYLVSTRHLQILLEHYLKLSDESNGVLLITIVYKHFLNSGLVGACDPSILTE